MTEPQDQEPITERLLELVERLGRPKRIELFVAMIRTKDNRMIDEVLTTATWLGDPIPVEVLRELCGHRSWEIRYSAVCAWQCHPRRRAETEICNFLWQETRQTPWIAGFLTLIELSPDRAVTEARKFLSADWFQIRAVAQPASEGFVHRLSSRAAYCVAALLHAKGELPEDLVGPFLRVRELGHEMLMRQEADIQAGLSGLNSR
ncbi:hypothetical protein MCEMSE15_01046 [Fimbriimonadaceae bacterium]